MSSSSYVTTIGGYVAVAAIGLTIYYSTQKNKKRPGAPSSKASKSPEPQKEKRTAKKQRAEQHAQDAASQKSAPKAKPAAASVPSPAVGNDDAEDEINNKEFARQLSSVKQGKQFVAKAGNDQKKQKSVKQSRAQVHAFDDENRASPPSSTAGIDADDDQSPVPSPQVAAADAGAVDDMLEAPAPGPSSLRILPSETQQPKKAKKEKKPAEPALTKKQRQNRKKAEAAKAANDEAEQERKKLMEAQRRLARVSEGRPAKDGSQFVASVNGGSAWNAGKPNGQPAAATAAAPLLDTFDAPAPAAPSAPVSQGISASVASVKSDTWVSVPSEEEQLELLKSETEADEWNTVKSTKSKKGKKTSQATVSDKEEKVATKSSHSSKSAEPVQKAQAPLTNGKPAIANTYGSFSALSTQGPDDEEEEEQEWDV